MNNEKITTKEILEQLKENINIGINNIKKELEVNKTINKLIENSNDEDKKLLEETKEKVTENMEQLQKSLEKINEHKKLIDEILEATKDKNIEDTTSKLLQILLRK